LGVSYDVFDATSGDSPTVEELRPYRCVIWRVSEFNTGESWTVDQQRALTNYLQGGGSLLVASMEILSRLEEGGFASFGRDVLQVQSFGADDGAPFLQGVSGEPMGSGLNLTLDYTEYEDFFKELIEMPADVSDALVPSTNAAPVLLSGSAVVGIRSPKTGVDRPGRVVFLSFPLDAVPLGTGVGNNRAGLLRNILNFLAPPEGNSALTLDSDVYTRPGRATVEVEDLDLEGQTQTTVTFRSPRQATGVPVTLTATARRGLFRGAITLLPPGGVGAGPTLPVESGDTLQAEYFDASSGQVLNVSATVETDPPVISEVFVEPGYVDALVTWTTSEPADALVQYSESPGNFPINFTAYDPNFDVAHVLALDGLEPNRTYYFRVVSRDRAGNTTLDDNGGRLYTFRTLQPRSLPWTDDMEGGDTGWAIYTSDGSEVEWTLGVPGNSGTAHSPVHAWGSNLDGGPASEAESFLISPALALLGGNRAKLRFWQNYDFFPQSELDLFQYGEVLLITNAAAAPVTLVTVEDFSDGWEEMEIDLTPYVGHVVYVVWHYVLFSFETFDRVGWLVDDVAVTMENVAPGTLQITNNLAQAVYVLSGPVSRSGRGWGITLTNAPPGQYSILYGDLPFYQTPPAQTNVLVSGATIRFQGHYAMQDANANAVSDAWERAYFGSLLPGNAAQTDADHDGASDYAEFVAGTNPTNATSRLGFTPALAEAQDTLRLTWTSQPGRAYAIETSPDLRSWTPANDWQLATGITMTTIVPRPNGSRTRFYRLDVRP
jgi:hypothetical protein